jgi:hypothetical protein
MKQALAIFPSVFLCLKFIHVPLTYHSRTN